MIVMGDRPTVTLLVGSLPKAAVARAEAVVGRAAAAAAEVRLHGRVSKRVPLGTFLFDGHYRRTCPKKSPVGSVIRKSSRDSSPAVAAPPVPLVQSPPVDSIKEKKTPTVPMVEKSLPVDSPVPTVPVIPPQSSYIRSPAATESVAPGPKSPPMDSVTKEPSPATATAPPVPTVQSPPVDSTAPAIPAVPSIPAQSSYASSAAPAVKKSPVSSVLPKSPPVDSTDPVDQPFHPNPTCSFQDRRLQIASFTSAIRSSGESALAAYIVDDQWT
ncbi:hypothetical protein ACRALDRAFT_211084 [Sodiomyces alcalophilus JCM 7366]|uniref:uncharacterized protein n=1 Tax=Sodiomyces alcalophilus JCM 7366 TaxID=591952 RepID=UPI0039B43D65